MVPNSLFSSRVVKINFVVFEDDVKEGKFFTFFET